MIFQTDDHYPAFYIDTTYNNTTRTSSSWLLRSTFKINAMAGTPALNFPNVITLEEQADEHDVHTDVPDTAPEEEVPAPRQKSIAAPPPSAAPSAGVPPTH